MAADSVLPLLVAAAVMSRAVRASTKSAGAGMYAGPGETDADLTAFPAEPDTTAASGPDVPDTVPADLEWDPGPGYGLPAGARWGGPQQGQPDGDHNGDLDGDFDTEHPGDQDEGDDLAGWTLPGRGGWSASDDPGDGNAVLSKRSNTVLDGDDAEAQATEALPMPAPLAMNGRGPPMTLSLEDMDYLTILRPPVVTASQTGATKGRRKANNNKGLKKVVKGKQVNKGKGGGSSGGNNNKSRQKASQAQAQGGGPPAGPGPAASSAAPYHQDSYGGGPALDGYLPYDAPHPYGYGYGYGFEYPRYADPIMTSEYQQAASYPEEERFRPLRHPPPMLPLMGPTMGAMGAMGPMTHPPPTMPTPMGMGSPLMGSPMASHMTSPMGSPASSAGGYATYQDQRPSGSGAVQVSQSLAAGEHHSSHDAAWLSGLGSPSTTRAPAAPAPDPPQPTTKKATLKDILAEDCPGADELGYCDSPPRYPMQQVAEAIERCSELMEHMNTGSLGEQGADLGSQAEAAAEGAGACQSLRRVLRPGYVRDAASGRWLVALQSRGRVAQRVAVERCTSPSRPCARLADTKCARNLGFRNGARATSCEQRTTLVPVITWDPEAPDACPRLRTARFPVACVCRVA